MAGSLQPQTGPWMIDQGLKNGSNLDGGLPFIDHTFFLSAVAALALARGALPEHRELMVCIGDCLADHHNGDGGWACPPHRASQFRCHPIVRQTRVFHSPGGF
ncbi:hypothetical protein GCM10010277_80950 [Streptomyces longisporoflavus]|uniref:hypothetical protein n=1 Tax=Streptomyces longisporoflavus TaxID=28044 RepID=UPI00167D889A|nr:hypothetical protein [Streptomyces longisporoflavus]GGV70199.1 hypothetical protein GCM10010277_80950 [Streptomyces longisporoflavus]